MKICLVSQEYPPETGGGGIGTQTYLKAHGLTARGHAVHVVSASPNTEARNYQDGAATIHRIAEPRMKLPGYEPSTYWLAYSMAVAEKLHALAQQVAFDIIQFPEYGGEGFIYQTDTFRYRTARYVVQCHGPLAMFAEHMGWPEIGGTLHQIGCFMERTVLHHADLVMASSHCTAAFCAERYGYPLEKMHVVHSGIDAVRFAPRSAPPDARAPRILFVGNFVGNKGFNVLVDTVLRLRKRYPHAALRAIGRADKDVLRQTQARIAAAGAEANFELLGYVPYSALPEHYAWCDLFAGPSSFEGGPGNIYLEAMACGKPVVACNTGGVPEVVEHGQRGLLIPPGDGHALEAAIVALAEDRTLRERLGRNGRAWVEANVAIDKYIDKCERLYLSLIE
jgi:glycosyltransferase involved in cell wall biosynthesis